MINEYFEYIDSLISDDKRINKVEKKDLRDKVSFFKVSGYVENIEYIISNYDFYNYETQLYILFEYISTKIFTIKTYSNWVKSLEK